MKNQIYNEVTGVVDDVGSQGKDLSSLTPSLMTTAHIYRVAMHRNFGVGSETDTSITEKFVESYFAGKATAGVITAQEVADSELLRMTFPALAEWTGDGTAWTFAWNMVPQ